MGDDSGPFFSKQRLAVLFVVLAASSIWVTTRDGDELPPRDDGIPDSAATAAILPANVHTLVDSAAIEQRRGDWSAALGHLQRATARNPRDADAALALARCYRWMHRYGELIVAANNAIALSPGSVDAIVERVMASIVLGELENARAILDTTPTSEALHNALAAAHLGWVHRGAKKDAEARFSVSAAEHAFEEASRGRDVVQRTHAELELARALAQTGETVRAVEILGRLANAPSEVSAASYRIDPVWARLRGDKTFEAMLGDPI